MSNQIFVTKSFLPPIEEYISYIKKIWDSNILTNQGQLVQELQNKLKQYLGIKDFHYVTNGTITLQLALNVIKDKILDNGTFGDIITTPFSYVATTTSILWENFNPVFVDIEKDNFCIDTNKIEEKITKNTKAIMPVHVFGYICNVEKIEQIAKKHNLKVIYDSAHAFGVKYKNQSILNYGDISSLSFHATKVFHTIEGGEEICNNEELSKKIELTKRFGHNKDDYYCVGINAKQSEFNASMGLANLNHIDNIIKDRKRVCDLYDNLLDDLIKNKTIQRPKKQKDTTYNYAYYPVILPSEKILLKTIKKLNETKINPRRYFYPSLNILPYLKDKQSCPISEDIANRIICLPLYVGLEDKNIEKISKIIKENL